MLDMSTSLWRWRRMAQRWPHMIDSHRAQQSLFPLWLLRAQRFLVYLWTSRSRRTARWYPMVFARVSSQLRWMVFGASISTALSRRQLKVVLWQAKFIVVLAVECEHVWTRQTASGCVSRGCNERALAARARARVEAIGCVSEATSHFASSPFACMMAYMDSRSKQGTLGRDCAIHLQPDEPAVSGGPA